MLLYAYQAQCLAAVQTLSEYKAEVQALRRQQDADKKKLEFANKQVLQLSADRADTVARSALLQSVNEKIEQHQAKLQSTLDKVCDRMDSLERLAKRLKVMSGQCGACSCSCQCSCSCS